MTTFAYNPASQIVSTVRTGDAYAYTDHFNLNVTGTPNGLNQLTQVGAKSLTHDANGNVTAFGTRSFTYNAENQLLTGPGSTTLSYDPAMRLYQTVAGAATTRMAYDGLDRIAEYACPDPCGGDGSDIIQRRYVHGPGLNEPIVWYEGTGTSDRRFLSSDERGSIISVTDSTGALLRINRYDEYGNPQSTNLGVWGYTGQAWLPGMGGWYYKARVYDRELGRFLQPDPIGYEGGPNLYAYVRNDPINLVDPLGLECTHIAESRICLELFSEGQQASYRAGFGILSPGAGVSGAGRNIGGSYVYRPGSVDGATTGADVVVTASVWVWQPSQIGSSPPIGFPRIFKVPPTRVPKEPPPYNPAQSYCGAEGGAGFPGGTWNKACYTHDVCYGTPGASKGQCDARLAADIREQCGAQDPSDPVCSGAAFIYYWAVRFGGGGPFERAQRGGQ